MSFRGCYHLSSRATGFESPSPSRPMLSSCQVLFWVRSSTLSQCFDASGREANTIACLNHLLRCFVLSRCNTHPSQFFSGNSGQQCLPFTLSSTFGTSGHHREFRVPQDLVKVRPPSPVNCLPRHSMHWLHHSAAPHEGHGNRGTSRLRAARCADQICATLYVACVKFEPSRSENGVATHPRRTDRIMRISERRAADL